MSKPADVFISYSRDDREITQEVARQLERRGMTVWWDLVSIRAGQDFEALVRRALNRVKCVVVLWTDSSVDPARSWVRAEAKIGFSRGILVPVLLVHPDEVPLPHNLLDFVDLRGWNGAPDAPEFVRLMEQIELCVRAGPAPHDDFDPSIDDLAGSADIALRASEQAGAIVADLRQTAPRLRNADPQAVAQLDTVLDEVHATVRAVNEAVTLFMRPGLSSDPIDKDPTPYLELASRDLIAVIEEGRGHCGDIDTLYFGSDDARIQRAAPARTQALRFWVHNNMSAAEAAQIDDVFQRLAESDIDLFERMGQVGYRLSNTAMDVIRLLAHARPDDARALVISAFDVLQPLQAEYSERMQDIRRLQSEIRKY
jgi:hypothetical protein